MTKELRNLFETKTFIDILVSTKFHEHYAHLHIIEITWSKFHLDDLSIAEVV